MTMCSNKWPTLLDLSRDECKRMLRSLELEAYASLVTAFRAQGDLNKDKRKVLQDLQSALSISTERHRAEIRRATNDEKLTTIADNIAGPDVSSEWLIEGRRLIPLMPRLVPQTAFTLTANNAATVQNEKNTFMQTPSQTANADANVNMPEPIHAVTAPSKPNRPTSPTSSVVVLPSGMSIHIKGGLNTEEEDIHGKRRRRSSSAESIVMTRTTPVITTVTSASKMQSINTAAHSNSIQGISPMKISVTKSPVKSHTTTVTPAQKVIIVSSSASAAAGSNIIQKSIQIPIVKTGVTTTITSSTASHPRSSIVVPSSATVSLGPPSNASGGSYVTANYSTPKARVKHITTRQKTPQQFHGRSGIMLPMGGQHVPTGTPMQNIQIKPVTKPTIHIKQEGSMKIITQGIPGGTSKILPKPSGGAPVVVVTTVPSSSHLTKTITTTGPAGKVLNFSTSGGRLIAASGRGTTANVVTVNPKTLQLATVRGPSGATVLTGSRISTPTGAKPNVIVVQKAQTKRSQAPTTPTTIHISKSSASSSPFEKELVSFIQKQDIHKPGPGQAHKFSIQKGSQKQTVEFTKRPIVVRQHSGVEMVQKSLPSTVTVTTAGIAARSSLLAELIQAVGIGPDSAPSQVEEVVLTEDPCAISVISGDSQKDSAQNQWVEYDVETAADNITESSSSVQVTSEIPDTTDASAIKALLDLQSNSQGKASRNVSSDMQQESTEGQQDFLTLEQVQNMIANQTATVQPVVAASTPPDEVTHSRPSGVEIHISEGTGSTGQAPLELGELDPETGLFYTTSVNAPTGIATVETTAVARPRVETIVINQNSRSLLVKDNIIHVSRENPVSSSRTANVVATTVAESTPKGELEPKQLDFLSNALNQAQIDLDPYQFIEEDEPAPFTTKSPHETQAVSVNESVTSESQGPLVSILSPQPSLAHPVTFNTMSKSTTARESHTATTEGSQSNVNDVATFLPDELIAEPSTSGVISSQVVTTSAPAFTPAKSFIPIQDVLRKQTATVGTVSQRISDIPTTNVVAVTVESTGATGLDTTSMKIEDFASQRYTEQADGDMPHDDASPFGSPSSSTPGSSLLESQDAQAMRLSKRKRKPPPTPDEITMQTSVGGWVRLALGLLQRICRFRGSYKEKGEMNAASWFTRPVDPSEVPDYYSIIINPMDFGTIKKKLEAGQYHDWEDFHVDMTLVRDNCLQYNPIGTDVRRDCEEVFAFYLQEYDKALIKWQQTHITTSPSGKKVKLSSSPVRIN